MKAVILGGGGFIGANLARRLRSDGWHVEVVDVNFPAFRHAHAAQHHTIDLTWPFPDWLLTGTDVVFHLAADMGGVGYFHSDADLGASMINGQITLNVAQAVAKTGTRTFYASSACAYPIEGQMTAGAPPLLSEDMVGHGTPDALYGAEKLHGLRVFGKIPNARVGILHTVYGPLQEHEGRRMKFPAAVATKALAARETGRLELWGDGSQMRSYLHVDDAVDRILAVALADQYEGPVNIGSGSAVTCMEVARMCLDITGANAEIVTNPAEPSGVLARNCDNSKFERVYGPVKERSPRDGFAEFIDWLGTKTATCTAPDRAVMPSPRVR